MAQQTWTCETCGFTAKTFIHIIRIWGMEGEGIISLKPSQKRHNKKEWKRIDEHRRTCSNPKF